MIAILTVLTLVTLVIVFYMVILPWLQGYRLTSQVKRNIETDLANRYFTLKNEAPLREEIVELKAELRFEKLRVRDLEKDIVSLRQAKDTVDNAFLKFITELNQGE